MPRISEIDPAHAPEAIQKIIADHVSDGHALTAEKRTLRTHPWQEPEREATLEEIALCQPSETCFFSVFS